jgi:isocitrate/isopropylmalate dehydrogenase
MSPSAVEPLNGASTIAPPSRNHNYRIASIPADGIGPEVISAAIEVVNKVAETLKTFTVEFTHLPWGTAYYKKTGKYVDDNVLEVLKSYDAGLFGAVGAPGKSNPPHFSLSLKPSSGKWKKRGANHVPHRRP